MKLSKWAKSQGISYTTAWRWWKTNKLPVKAYQAPSGAVIVQEEQKINEVKKTVIYARVSSNPQKEYLKRQAERIRNFCLKNGWVIDGEYLEIASGLNDKRPKLLKLLKSQPNRIVVEHKDRLTRFGFNYFQEILPLLGIELVVINRDVIEESDLIKDLVAIITSFCCRIYGARRGQNKAKLIKTLVEDSNGKK